MSQEIIDIGNVPGDGTGDPLRTAMDKININFDQIWNAGPVGTNVTIDNRTISTLGTNSNLILAGNGVGTVQSSGTFVPRLNNTWNLGTANLRWQQAYFGSGGINTTGTINAVEIIASGDVLIDGNLIVEGNTIQLGNITTDSLTVQLANTANTANLANGAGMTVGANDNIATILYSSSSNVWQTNIGITATGNVTAPYFIGNGSLLTGITSYGNANVAAYLPTYTGNLAGSRLEIDSPGANLWVIDDDTITAPSGGQWRSDSTNKDDYFTSGLDGYVNLQSLYANGNIASEVHLEHGLAHITLYDGANRQWLFENSGNLTVPGNILPDANGVYSLGSSTQYWSNLWVANNTIYIGGVPLGISAGNVLTVNGEALLSNDSDTSITTTGNITANVITATGAINVGDMSIGELPGYITADANIGMVVNVSGPDGGFVVDYLKEDGNANTSQGELAFSSETGNATYRISLTDDAGDGFATKIWRFDGTGNFNLPSGGNIVGITPNNDGRIQWVGNSSGDGFGYTTLGLIPDDTLTGTDQYLIIDPTAPGHIHIRAGGTQDNSSADLFLGGEYTHFKVTAGANNQARILANSWPWTFGSDGTFTLPANAELNGSQINSVANSSGDGAGYTTLQLVPDVTVGTGTDQYLIIDPTAPGHIHIRAGGTQDDSSADLILGGENSHVKVTAGLDPPVYIRANNQSWTFTTDGVFQTPGDISVNGNVTANYFIGNGSQLTGLPASYSDANVATFLAAYGSNTISTSGNVTAGNFLGSGTNVDIIAGSHDWTFDSAGNLTLPGNTFAVNYANGTAVALGGNYNDSNVATFLAAFGSNTVSTTGNVTAGYFFGNGSQLTAVNAVTADVTNTNGLTTVYYPTFVESRTTGQILRADTDLSYRTDTNTLTAGRLTVTASGTAINAGSGDILTNQVTGTQFNFLNGVYTVNLNAGQAVANYALRLPANAGTNGQTLTTDGTGNLSWSTPAGSYGNSNVATFLANYGSNTISTTGNITAGNISGNISITGNVTGTSANVDIIAGSYQWTFNNAGNLVLPGNTFSVNYANGTAVTLGGSYGNANVADFLDSLGSNAIITTGNITSGNLITSGAATTGVNALLAGPTFTPLSNTAAGFVANVNNYSQITFQNKNTGADATADYILTADNGSDTVNYGDFGIINSGYDVNTPTNSLGNIVRAGDTYIYAQGNVSNTSQSGGNLVLGTTVANKYVKIFAGGNTASALVANISNTGISVTGNVTATNFIGNVSLTGNIQGTSANVELVAGSYTFTFDNTGVATFPAVGGDEGGEINFGIPAANTTLTSPVKVDVYQDRIRFFDGSTKGAYIDMSQAGTGVSTLLNNRVSGYVNAGTYVTMDNLKATVSTAGNRSLQIATVSGSYSVYVNATYTLFGGGTTGSGATFTLTTTPTLAIAWNFTAIGDTVIYIINDITNSRTYRVTMMIGPSYNNNLISIERLI